MKSFLSVLSFVVSVPALAIEADKDTAGKYNLSARLSDECLLLANKNCKGNRQELRLETPSGYFISIEKIADHAAAVPLDQSYGVDQIGNLHARIAWDKQISGTIARFGKTFRPAEQTAFHIEAYIGNITGTARLNAFSEATTQPISITLPPFSGEINGHTIDQPSRTITHAGGHEVLADYSDTSAGKTYYGGLRQSLGTAFKPYKNTYILLNQFAQAGLDRISYGAGLGLAYASAPDQVIGERTANICQGGHFRSNARFAIAFSACAEKIKMDRLYDALHDKAKPLAARITAELAKGQDVINGDQNGTGYSYTLPQNYTATDLLHHLGIESPYDRIKTNFVMAVSTRIGNGHLTLSHSHPLTKSNDGNGRTSVAMSYDF